MSRLRGALAHLCGIRHPEDLLWHEFEDYADYVEQVAAQAAVTQGR